MIDLIPIDASGFVDNPARTDGYAAEVCRMTADWYQQSGFVPPWLGYLALQGGQWVGVGGFKGAPRDGRVEISYHTFPDSKGRGVATEIARGLVRIAQAENAALRLLAQTLPEPNASTAILTKLGFERIRTVQHPEDGEVWEWELPK